VLVVPVLNLPEGGVSWSPIALDQMFNGGGAVRAAGLLPAPPAHRKGTSTGEDGDDNDDTGGSLSLDDNRRHLSAARPIGSCGGGIDEGASMRRGKGRDKGEREGEREEEGAREKDGGGESPWPGAGDGGNSSGDDDDGDGGGGNAGGGGGAVGTASVYGCGTVVCYSTVRPAAVAVDGSTGMFEWSAADGCLKVWLGTVEMLHEMRVEFPAA